MAEAKLHEAPTTETLMTPSDAIDNSSAGWHNSVLGQIEALAHTNDPDTFLQLLELFTKGAKEFPEMTARGFQYHFGIDLKFGRVFPTKAYGLLVAKGESLGLNEAVIERIVYTDEA
jgi:hypothetical protein